MPESGLDEIDARILNELQRNARLTNVELASKVGLSPSPCLARVRALHQAGIIQRHVTILDAEQLGWRLTAFVEVSLRDHSAAAFSAFREMVHDNPRIMDCYMMAADADYLVRVVGKDIGDLRDLIMNTLMPTKCVATCRSSVVLEEIKRETAFKIDVRG